MDSVCCTPLYLLIFYRSLVIVGAADGQCLLYTSVPANRSLVIVGAADGQCLPANCL